jgi:hypothetical protein
MKFPRATFTVSLLLNIVLLAVAGFLLTAQKSKSLSKVATKTVSLEAESEALEVLTSEPEKTSEPTRAPFDWSMVASTDLEIYVKNLRAIGCPKSTIRDIIVAEADQIFLKKLAEQLDPIRQGFWTILANWKTQEKEVEQRVKGLEKIGDERDEMLTKLLGEDYEAKPTFKPSERNDERLSFLPKEKQEQILALERDYNEWRNKLRKETNGKSTPEQQRSIQEMAKQVEEKRKALMTAEEFEEYQLRSSPYTKFRRNPAAEGFTEEEIRKIAKVQMEYDQSQPKVEKSPESREDRDARNAAIEQQLKAALGEERYVDYKRSEDGAFQQVYRLTERYNLPRDTAVNVYEIQQSATKQANELRKAKNISDDEREALLFALQDETKRNVTKTLGENAAKTYGKHGGNWLEHLVADQ